MTTLVEQAASVQASKRAIPGVTTSEFTPRPPTSSAEVAKAIQDMDQRFGTSFESWIRSETNVAYICAFKRTLIEEYMEKSPNRVMHALQWMTRGWSTSSVAELILKLFYHIKIDSAEFARVVAAITDTWDMDALVELINVLLIGESAAASASFICYFTDLRDLGRLRSTLDIDVTRKWRSGETIALVESLSETLRWRDSFLETFLTTLTEMCVLDVSRREMLIESMSREFREIRLSRVMDHISKRMLEKYEMIVNQSHDAVKGNAHLRDDSSERTVRMPWIRTILSDDTIIDADGQSNQQDRASDTIQFIDSGVTTVRTSTVIHTDSDSDSDSTVDSIDMDQVINTLANNTTAESRTARSESDAIDIVNVSLESQSHTARSISPGEYRHASSGHAIEISGGRSHSPVRVTAPNDVVGTLRNLLIQSGTGSSMDVFDVTSPSSATTASSASSLSSSSSSKLMHDLDMTLMANATPAIPPMRNISSNSTSSIINNNANIYDVNDIPSPSSPSPISPVIRRTNSIRIFTNLLEIILAESELEQLEEAMDSLDHIDFAKHVVC